MQEFWLRENQKKSMLMITISVDCSTETRTKASESCRLWVKVSNCLICIFHLLFLTVLPLFRQSIFKERKTKMLVSRQMNWTTNLVTESMMPCCPRNAVTGGNKQPNNVNGTINRILVDFSHSIVWMWTFEWKRNENELITIHWQCIVFVAPIEESRRCIWEKKENKTNPTTMHPNTTYSNQINLTLLCV